MSHQSEDEALKSRQKKMGDEIGECYHYCLNAVFDLSITWDQYETLFQNKERIEVLNQVNELLARSIQRHFWNAVVLGLSRITDAPEVSGKPTLSILRLIQLCSNEQNLRFDDLSHELENKVKVLRKARNKILAHNDYKVATKKAPYPEMGSRQNITSVFRILISLLGRITSHFEQSHLFFLPQGNASAWALIYNLHFGLKFIAETEQKAVVGDWTEIEKLESPTWLAQSESETNRYKTDQE